MNLIGSNQYKTKERFLRPKTIFSVMYIFAIFSSVMIAYLAADRFTDKLIPPLKTPIAYAGYISNSVYQEPVLNPNVSERDQNIALIKKIWGRDSWTGLQISRCEAGLRTLATNINTNGTVDQGLFQINSVHGIPSMDNAVANISYAYVMFKEQGFAPWSASKKCWNAVLAEK